MHQVSKYVVVVLTLAHNQARGHRTASSHPGAEEYPREQTQTNQRWYTHTSQPTRIHHSRRNSCLRQEHKKMRLRVSLLCARSILGHPSHSSRLEKPTIPLATQERRPRKYYTSYLSLRMRTSDASQLKNRKKIDNERKEREEKEGEEKKREKIKSEIVSQPTMCQVHTGTYVSLLAPEKTDDTASQPEKTTQ